MAKTLVVLNARLLMNGEITGNGVKMAGTPPSGVGIHAALEAWIKPGTPHP